ncbi:Protein kinase of the Mitotic Exit Network, partial [Coemansia sp. RSA 485]
MGEARRIGEYQLEDIIGKGAAGSVYRGINLRTGGVVAIKQIRKEGFSSYDEIESARKEIDMLRDLNHPNIVKYIGYEQTDDELDIILEYCEGGSLQNILRKFNKFPENLVGVYVAQILDGLSYLHSNAILHRDIKPGNILLLKEGVVKLADFGVARVQNGMDTVVGSPYWIAPEVLQLKGATTASDIWSLGCTIVQMVDGKAPYQDLQPMAAMFRIGQDEHPPFPHNISVLLRDFLSKCLVHVPSARATADELRNHEWIRICLREQQREQQRDGQPQRNYERDIRAITQWNQVLQNSSPRDVKRFSINNNNNAYYYPGGNNSNSNNNGNNGGPGYSQHPSSSYSNTNVNAFASYSTLNNSSGNLNNSYGSAKIRDDITGAISGVSSMGISNSNDSATRRTVSSIAAYEEDSGDDWDNAFENLDALQLKPKTRPGILYPQSIGIPMSPAVGPRKHSLSIASDAPESENVNFMAATAERAVSDPANGHGAGSLQLRPHTSPPSPRMTALKNASTMLPPVDYMSPEYEDGRNSTSSNENGFVEPLEYIDGGRVSGSSAYYASATDVRLDAISEVSSKRPSLGLRQDYAHSASTQLVQTSSSVAHQRDNSQLSAETPDASSDHLPSLLYQQQQQQQQQQQLQQQHGQRHYQAQQQQLSGPYQKQKPPHLRHRVQESRDIIPPGFPSKASEERLRRETEIRWVQDIGSIVNQLRGCTREELTIRYCQQVVVLLREGRGVFSACQDWRVRSIVDAIRIHQGNTSATKHLIVLVNRLCHMDSRYSRTFCLHGILPLILPILYRQKQSQKQAQGQQGWVFSSELQAECIGFISRLCRAEDSS